MRGNNIIYSIILTILSVFTGLVIVELFTYFFLPAQFFYRINVTTLGREYTLSPNKTLIYEPKPGGGEFNKYGYRGEEFDYERNDKKRIVFIGDSVVEGIGVKPEERFTELLNDNLGDGFEVINLGVSGYSFLQEFEYLKKRGLKFSPDYVFWGICQNDFDVSSLELEDMDRRVRDIAGNGFYSYYYTNINKLEEALLSLNVYRYAKFFLSRGSRSGLRDKADYNGLRKPEMQSLLKKLKSMSIKHDFKIVFILLPIRPPSELPVKISDLRSLIKRERFIYLDLDNHINGIWLDSVHLNPGGHRMVADMIYSNITGDIKLRAQDGSGPISEKKIRFVFFYPTIWELGLLPGRNPDREFLNVKDVDSSSDFLGEDGCLYMVPEESYFLFSGYLFRNGYKPVVEDLFHSPDAGSNFVALSLSREKLSDAIVALDLEDPFLNHVISGGISDPKKVKIIQDGVNIENNILDISGGEEQLMIPMFADTYVLEADFRVVRSRLGLVFGAQDKGNLYMHQIISGPGPAVIRWHKKIDGEYIIMSETELPLVIEHGKWYHVRCLVNKADFKIYLSDLSGEQVAGEVIFAEWTDPGNLLSKGYIGFREFSDPKSEWFEHAQIDNIVIKSL